jgi:flagellar basal-body rod modification protein FlgD
MSVSGINPLVPSLDTGTARKTDEVGQDDFLNLLIAQLQAQDPLNPLESAEFTAQLAQFNSLEKLIEVNTRLEALTAAQLFSGNAQFVDYIGKTVKASGNTTEMIDGRSAELHFELAGDARSVFVNILDAGGFHVRTLEAGGAAAGERSVEWNGRDDNGNPVPEGSYSFEVAAVDAVGNAVAAAPFSLDRITGVTFQNDSAQLLAEQKTIPVSQVMRIEETDDR